jgi:hypothetical protein
MRKLKVFQLVEGQVLQNFDENGRPRWNSILNLSLKIYKKAPRGALFKRSRPFGVYINICSDNV